MRRQLNKITITFVLIALIPFGFIVHELTSRNKNEMLVREIYRNQLDAILYSVNQYSDDVVSSWANRIDNALALTDENPVDLRNALETGGAVRYIYLTDLNGNSNLFGIGDSEVTIRTRLDETVRTNTERIQKLLTYQRAGFRKMEPIDTASTGNLIAVFFVLDQRVKSHRVGALVIDLTHFVQQNLGPKMQSVAQEQFTISVFKSGSNKPVYSTSLFNTDNPETDNLPAANEWQKRPLWLLPGHHVAISLAGATLEDLVRDRMTTSVTILIVLILLLSAAIIFLYRNIRREMHLAQAKSEFVSNVSHEIRTPLSLISMYAESLEMGRVTPEKKKEYYQIISRETVRLSRIVNRILDFSQLESNRKNFDIRPQDLNALCHEILESYSLQLTENGFKYEFNPDTNLPRIYGDREAICEAVINLLDNAIKYSPDRKHIIMTTGTSGKHVFLEVRDDGIGIAKNYQSDIFEQFFRAPAGDVHTIKGSGLGLTLVKRIMDAHHGKVTLESAPGKGSTFTLYFPVNRGQYGI